jgi:two-component system, LytTR family, response regulator
MSSIRVYVVDDERLAVQRLSRLLEETGKVDVIATATDPVEALEWLRATPVDVLFLDIEMPGLSGFDLLSQLGTGQPLVVFTTAYNQYALKAFEVHSVDYLLKPVEREHLDRALGKLERILNAGEPRPDVQALLRQLAFALNSTKAEYPERLASRLGERIEVVDLSQVTHIYAKDKLTYAATADKDYCLDQSILELEQKLDPKRFVRIHRSTLVNITYVHELYTWFAGRLLVRLKDDKRTELTVARDRVKALKDRLSI